MGKGRVLGVAVSGGFLRFLGFGFKGAYGLGVKL